MSENGAYQCDEHFWRDGTLYECIAPEGHVGRCFYDVVPTPLAPVTEETERG